MNQSDSHFSVRPISHASVSSGQQSRCSEFVWFGVLSKYLNSCLGCCYFFLEAIEASLLVLLPHGRVFLMNLGSLV